MTCSAAGDANHVTSGATCSGASGSASPSLAPKTPSVMRVRARGAMALARTPYLAHPNAVDWVSAMMPAFAAA